MNIKPKATRSERTGRIWVHLGRIEPGGHRLFKDPAGARAGAAHFLALADNSGNNPDETDDQALWIDFTRPLTLEPDSVSIPLLNELGQCVWTATGHRGALKLLGTLQEQNVKAWDSLDALVFSDKVKPLLSIVEKVKEAQRSKATAGQWSHLANSTTIAHYRKRILARLLREVESYSPIEEESIVAHRSVAYDLRQLLAPLADTPEVKLASHDLPSEAR